jgi:hypothetical protein
MKKLIVFLKKCLLIATALANKLFSKKRRQYVHTVADDTLFV